MNDDNTDTETISRDFVRQIFSRSNRIQINNQGITPEKLNTLFNNNADAFAEHLEATLARQREESQL